MRPNIIKIKKKSFLLLIVFCMGVTAMAQNTIVTKTIKPFQDAIPVVFQDNVKGGFHQVSDTTSLNASLKSTNMLVWQEKDHNCYQWNGQNWEQVKIIRKWAEGNSFYAGDLFLYQRKLVLALTNGTIASGDNPLIDAANWASIQSGNLESGKIWVGNSSGIATAVGLAGDVTINNNGETTLKRIQNIPLKQDTPIDGQVLKYNGTSSNQWEAATITSVVTGTQTNNTLYWNGTEWEESDALINDASDITVAHNLTVNDSVSVAKTLNVGDKIILENGESIRNASNGIVDITADTLAVAGNVSLNGGHLITTATNASLFNSGATSLTIGGASDSTTIGAENTSGVTIVHNNLKVGNPTVDKIAMNGGALMVEGDTEIDGTIWVKDLQTSSDKRLKTNIKTLANVLEKLEQLRGVSYEFKDQQKYASGSQVGVIAQELQAVYPQLVAQSADGYLTVNYPQLTAVLLQAIKEQQIRIEEINRRLEQIEKRLGEAP